ncbi:hypothetical protein BASA81_003750 [Batrachochytrium salamandrivorans]|nr:hypothetical protein BASA81_003750 [Batrachochytrium salamandrivorans]
MSSPLTVIRGLLSSPRHSPKQTRTSLNHTTASPPNHEHNTSPILLRNGSSLTSLSSRLGLQFDSSNDDTASFSTMPPEDVLETFETRQLDLLLGDRQICHELVHDFLLAGLADEAFQVRFLAYYNDYSKTEDKTIRTNKGRKILEMFIQPQSQFQLAVVRDQQIRVTSTKDLPRLKHHLLHELIKLSPVIRMLQTLSS